MAIEFGISLVRYNWKRIENKRYCENFKCVIEIDRNRNQNSDFIVAGRALPKGPHTQYGRPKDHRQRQHKWWKRTIPD